jgi:F-type H+-transporting ATPase subunit gamma
MSGVALRERLLLLEELRQIVAAMRNLAYAEMQRLNRAQAAQAKAERAVVRALADTVRGRQGRDISQVSKRVWLVIGAERGFCGSFNDRLADAMPALIGKDASASWLIAGSRLRQRVEGIVPEATWLAGCSGAEESAACVDSWLSAMASGGHAPGEEAPTLVVVHHAEEGIAQHRLLPLPELPPPSPGPAPILHLPVGQLLPKLLAEAVRVGLLGALQQSLQQENHWRLSQMHRAEDYLDDAGTRLRHRYFRERQSAITSELETLMASLDSQSSQQSFLVPGVALAKK